MCAYSDEDKVFMNYAFNIIGLNILGFNFSVNP